MKALTKILTLSMALAVVAWSCKPESSVEPKKDGAPELGLVNDHPQPEPPCMPAVSYPFIDESGHHEANPDPSYYTRDWAYGTITVRNSPDILYLQIDATGAWNIAGARIFVGQCSQVSFRPDGTVNTESFPYQTDVNPVRQAWDYLFPMSELDMDAQGCACVVTYMEVCGLDANGDCSANRWVWGDGGQRLGTDGYSMTVCPIACPEGRPEMECYALNRPAGVNSASLRVVMQKGNPPFTYTWSTGYVEQGVAGGGWTSQPVVVSPTVTTQYSVTVTDSRAVSPDTIFFTVYPTASGCCAVPTANPSTNLSAWNCTNGNGQQKVKVCHLPPGNPANRQNLCIAVSALPAHIVDFKPISTPCMGHHSGCHIGPCDPCGPGSSNSSIAAAQAFMQQYGCPGN